MSGRALQACLAMARSLLYAELVVLGGLAGLVMPAPSAAQVPQPPSPQEMARLQALARRLQACGDDVACIERVGRELPPPPADAPPLPSAAEVVRIEALTKRLEACGSDLACIDAAQAALMKAAAGTIAGQPAVDPAKVEAQASELVACGTDLACIESALAALTKTATQASARRPAAVGTGWMAYRQHQPCSAVASPTCCLPVEVTVDNVSEYKLEPAPGHVSSHTLFSWRGEGRGELIYRPDFELFQLLASGTLDGTEVRGLTGFVEIEGPSGSSERRTVPNMPVRPRDPFTLGIDFPAQPGSTTNLVFRGAEVESADSWMPTYRGSGLSWATELRERFIVTPAMVRSSIDSGSLSKSLEWLEGEGTSITQDNRLDLEIRFGKHDEIRREKTLDRACPSVVDGLAAYESRLDLGSRRLVVVVRILTRRRAVYRHLRPVATFRARGGPVKLLVTEVVTGDGEPEQITISAQTLDALRKRWEQEIETMWNDRFEVDCGCLERPVRIHFDVQFVEHGGHHRVDVVPGPGRSTADTWYEKEERGVAAHEFGHLLGLEDEYAESDCPRRVSGDGSIMNQYWNGVPKRRHYEQFARWLSRRGGGKCRVLPVGCGL